MKKSRLLGALCSCLIIIPITVNADTVVYTDRDAFYGQLGTVVIDDYEYPGSYTDAAMSAVLGETTYTVVSGGGNTNFVNSSNANAASNAWCNGCNLSTLLDFTSTSVGDSVGVLNVGFDIVHNESGVYNAQVVFGDGNTQTYALPAIVDVSDGTPYGFWGISSTLKITRLTLLGDGGSGYVMDNLVIGNSGAGITSPPLQLHGVVPIPAAVWLFGSGLLGLVGMARRNKAA